MSLSRVKRAKLIGKADSRGEKAGRNAASWVWDDGRSRRRPSDYAEWLRKYRDGDPRATDFINEPAWLSGEHAGESIQELLGDLIEEGYAAGGDESFERELLDSYEAFASDAFWNAIVDEAKMRAKD